MTRLMRAEWYRFSHSGSVFRIYIATCLLSVAMSYINSPDILDMTLLDAFTASVNNSAVLWLPMFVGCPIAVSIGNSYGNRTAFYEIMDGSDISRIILSKCAVYSLASLLFYVVPFTALMTVLAIKNGIGDISSMAVFIIMALLAVIRLFSCSVLWAMLTRHSVAGAMLIFMLYGELQGALFAVLLEFYHMSPETVLKIQEWFYFGHFSFASSNSGESRYIIAALAGTAIEVGVLYLLVYSSYKNKKIG